MIRCLNARSWGCWLMRMGTQLEEGWIGREVRRLAGPQATSISSYTRPLELRALYRLARLCPAQARAVEIGSHLGASTCYIAAGLRAVNGRLYCVDTWNNETMPGGVHDNFAEFRANVASLGQTVVPIQKRSQELTAADLPLPVHLAFIDGDHSYEAARNDFEVLSPRIAHGGYLAFHDFGKGMTGVTKLVAEVLSGKDWRVGGVADSLIWLIRKHGKSRPGPRTVCS